MHRMRASCQGGLDPRPRRPVRAGGAARADLIRPNAAQSFPDLASDIVGSQAYTYDAATQTGTFVVNNAPSLIALGPQRRASSYVYDPPGQPRSETIQVKLDSSGNLVDDPGNSFSVYGSVTIDGKSFSGPAAPGDADRRSAGPRPSPGTPTDVELRPEREPHRRPAPAGLRPRRLRPGQLRAGEHVRRHVHQELLGLEDHDQRPRLQRPEPQPRSPSPRPSPSCWPAAARACSTTSAGGSTSPT